jgi:Flp pilus assembly pilin Flp
MAAHFFRRAQGFLRDDRGAVIVEYTVITGAVALATITALLLCGWAVANHFATVRWYLLQAYP